MRAVADSPASSEPYRIVSKIFSDSGRDRSGIEYFRAIASREPERWQPWFYKGYHEFHLNRWEEALDSFRHVNGLEPDNAEAHSRSGMILEYMGRLDEAAVAFRTAYELEPGSARYATRHAKSLRMGGDYAAAEQIIEQALGVSPDSGELHYAQAQIRLRQGRPAEAEAALRRALELAPRHAAAHKDLAGLLARAGRESEARLELAIADRLTDHVRYRQFLLERLGVKTGNAVLPLRLAELELTAGRFPQALEWFARAEALGGASARIRAGRAEALFGRGQTAAGHAELANISADGDPRELLARAAGLATEGALEEAMRLTDAAVAAAPADPDFLRRAADLNRRAGRLAESLDLLERAASTPRPPTP
jgi:tetratricopeptide (TPR) repeat protein